MTEAGAARADLLSRDGMMPSLLAADPGFASTWRAWNAEWEGEPDPPLFRALTALARYLVSQLERGETARFGAVFDVVEHWHVHGDIHVREAATVGLLEDLQNANLHARTHPAQFEPWLRPASRQCWDALDRFWSAGDGTTVVSHRVT